MSIENFEKIVRLIFATSLSVTNLARKDRVTAPFDNLSGASIGIVMSFVYYEISVTAASTAGLLALFLFTSNALTTLLLYLSGLREMGVQLWLEAHRSSKEV